MKVKVNQDACIGCGACVAICDKVFDFNDQGVSFVKDEEACKDNEQEVRDAGDSCPTGAIEVSE